MQNIKRELLLREEESENILSFLKYMESSANISGRRDLSFDSTTVMTSIKAGMILMLYNTVESTITKCLERLHEIIISQNLHFDECNEKLKKLIIVYYENAKEKSSDIHSSAPYILEFYQYIKGDDVFNITYKELSRFYSLYSGNLDSKEIISVLDKYGIIFEERQSVLKTIKDNRNKLAHGELTFEEAGRSLSVPQLEVMKDRTFAYMEKTVYSIEQYVNNREYKIL